jgi:hypothetical protein
MDDMSNEMYADSLEHAPPGADVVVALLYETHARDPIRLPN